MSNERKYKLTNTETGEVLNFPSARACREHFYITGNFPWSHIGRNWHEWYVEAEEWHGNRWCRRAKE